MTAPIGVFRVRLWSTSFLEVMSRAEALLMFFENGRENLLNQLLPAKSCEAN
jgi:hypothetical protein